MVFAVFFASEVLRGQATQAEDEQEFLALRALARQSMPKTITPFSDAMLEWITTRNMDVHVRGLAFIAKYPESPFRWDAVILLGASPLFTKTITENGESRSVRDEEALRVWDARYERMLEELIVAPDVRHSARGAALNRLMEDVRLNWKKRIHTPEGQAKLRKLEGWWAVFERDFRGAPALVRGAQAMAEVLDAADPARCEQFLRKLHAEYRGKGKPDTEIFALAEGRLKLLHGQAEEVWLRLRTISGQFADTREYRGKILVLATAPITFDQTARFLLHLHERYRAKGVEIIHVATGVTDDGRPELNADEVAAVVAARGYPWRVVYDGKDRFGEFTRSLGLAGYPVYLVLSRDGRFVAENPSQTAILQAIEAELALPSEAATKR